MNSFKNQIRNTDVYLIDQILKGNFDSFKSVLDVGCGEGRNLPYFLENGFDVYGLDSNANRIQNLLNLPNTNPVNFKVEAVENCSFSNSFDIIICNAVLHFAKSKTHFEEMLYAMWSRLSVGGILFIRLASDIGIENLIESIGDGVYKLPDTSTRYLVNQQMLLEYTQILNGTLVDPIKTTNVQNLRCMTTWVLRKS